MERFNPSYKDGLTSEQVNKRYQENLVNYDEQPKTKTIKEIVKTNCFTFFNYLNIGLGIFALVGGILGGQGIASLKNCLFMGVIIMNTIIGIIQEIISKKTIDKLSVLAESKVKVIRDKAEKEISPHEIVMDDILCLEIGNQVVADCIIEQGSVEVNESFITGEEKTISKVKGDTLLSGSFIISGKCYAKVEHVGKENYISKISAEAKYVKQVNSVIMHSFESMLKVLATLIIPIGIVFLINQLIATDYEFSSAIISTTAALIGMIPEGLVLLTSSVLAVSVVRLARYKVLVQQLYCIETLARVDVICLDKTGTITEGNMEVKDIIIKGSHKEEEIEKVLKSITYALDDKSPTFMAIENKYKAKKVYQAVDSMPFSSIRKFSAVEFEDKTFYLGAPEYVLKGEEKDNEIEELQKDYRILVLASNKNKMTEKPSKLDVHCYILIQDKIRLEAKDTLEFFQNEGVDAKIISGDNHKTVAAIAKRAGLKNVKSINAMDINEENIDEIVREYNVFGRVKPDMKKKLVMALQKQGKTVAMTGDGVNDVLALKQADCSIAMAAGSEAARNVSQLVLLDNNFNSMPKILAEGRRSINNVERSASLLLMKTIFTILLILICIFTTEEYFFIPIHLTLITFFTISVPSFILALEPNTNLVKNHFMIRIISKALPPALTVVFNIVMILLFRNQFGLDVDLCTTLTVFLTGATGFIFLKQICQPFNMLRTILFVVLLLGFIYITLTQYTFFNIMKFNFDTALIFGVLLICSMFVFDKINAFVKWCLKVTKIEI